jgi:hypothetical protein
MPTINQVISETAAAASGRYVAVSRLALVRSIAPMMKRKTVSPRTRGTKTAGTK